MPQQIYMGLMGLQWECKALGNCILPKFPLDTLHTLYLEQGSPLGGLILLRAYKVNNMEVSIPRCQWPLPNRQCKCMALTILLWLDLCHNEELHRCMQMLLLEVFVQIMVNTIIPVFKQLSLVQDTQQQLVNLVLLL